MAEHKHGTMRTTVQEKTYSGFIKAVTYSCVLIICILIFLAVFNS